MNKNAIHRSPTPEEAANLEFERILSRLDVLRDRWESLEFQMVQNLTINY